MKKDLSDKTFEDIVTPYDHKQENIVRAAGFHPEKLLKRLDDAVHNEYCDNCNEDSPRITISKVAELLEENAVNKRELAVYASFITLEYKALMAHPVVQMIKSLNR